MFKPRKKWSNFFWTITNLYFLAQQHLGKAKEVGEGHVKTTCWSVWEWVPQCACLNVLGVAVHKDNSALPKLLQLSTTPALCKHIYAAYALFFHQERYRETHLPIQLGLPTHPSFQSTPPPLNPSSTVDVLVSNLIPGWVFQTWRIAGVVFVWPASMGVPVCFQSSSAWFKPVSELPSSNGSSSRVA